MSKVLILGAGAAPGVPSLANGFGECDPKNEKNIRLRSGTYMEISGVKFLIDTSPDLRMQLILGNIRELDAVFYTHTHADHLHGIDDLREINRITGQAIELFASPDNLEIIRTRFPYLIAEKKEDVNPVYRAALHPNTFNYEESFYFQDLKQRSDLHFLRIQSDNLKYRHPVHREPMQEHPPEFQLRRLPFREFLHKNIVPTEDLPDGFCQYMNERYLCEHSYCCCLLYSMHIHKAGLP